MKAKTLYWRNGLVVKLLERVAERDDFLTKPVRYRATTKIHRPLIRANNFQIHVWLPIEMGEFIPILARLTRDLKRTKLSALKNGSKFRRESRTFCALNNSPQRATVRGQSSATAASACVAR